MKPIEVAPDVSAELAELEGRESSPEYLALIEKRDRFKTCRTTNHTFTPILAMEQEVEDGHLGPITVQVVEQIPGAVRVYQGQVGSNNYFLQSVISDEMLDLMKDIEPLTEEETPEAA